MPQESILIAVQMLCSWPDSSDEELIHKLVGAGMERGHATRLILFIPCVYARLILKSLGVQFSEKFVRSYGGGRFSKERTLASETVWLEVSEFAHINISALSSQERMLVAGRSPEFGVINQALNSGANASDMVLSHLVVFWPEEQPR